MQDQSVRCPNCRSDSVRLFYTTANAPTNSVLLLDSVQAAQDFPRGDIRLGFCDGCGFVTNTSFDQKLTEYSARYESTQGYSQTFNRFHEALARNLIERFDLVGKRIIEIGCGTGDFLLMLCEMGRNSGIGFDPAYIPGRHSIADGLDVKFVRDFYSAKYGSGAADFICCKMTLEHIHDTADFVRTIRQSLADDESCTVFFQVPNAHHVFGEMAFWDVYYEHCSYFSEVSLKCLFESERFEVVDTWTGYDDQYLMIAARPVGEVETNVSKAALALIRNEVRVFEQEIPALLGRWHDAFEGWRQSGKRVAIWGGGSKAVSFMSTLGLTTQVGCIVDINPHKAGTFLAGSGHEIVMPIALKDFNPDVVIIMNPIYRPEISQNLASMGLSPEILTV